MIMITVKAVTTDDPDLHRMIFRLDEDLLQRYNPEDIHGFDFNDPKVKEAFFAVAYAEGVPIGCGGIRPLDQESTELKRFFVESSYRGQGVAPKLLAFLEEEAQKRGHSVVKLETGAPQPEAIRFYGKSGYNPIERFGEYIRDKSSMCFEKRFL
jgi:putative acetyltransferase